MSDATNQMMYPRSCDTFVVLPPATANGCVIFGKNSDRPGNEVQEVIYRPAAMYSPGSKLQCTYIEIPQVEKTHAVILSKPAWMWGAEMGSNDQGLCIGNEAVWTKLNGPDDEEERLLGMDLLRLGLERASCAREGVDVITHALETHGQGGPCSDAAGSWFYHNSFILADRGEAWVLETAGKFWVAEKITEGVRNISNQLTITTKYDLSSPNLVEQATEAGLYKADDGPFNFAKVFDQDGFTHQISRYCEGKKLLEKFSSGGQFNVANMMSVLRDESSGINMDTGTCGSQVSLLPPSSASNIPCCHWFTATPSPSFSMFKPFIFTPNPKIGTLTTSPEFGDKDPAKVIPRFKVCVDRCHELYKSQERLLQLLVSDEAKAMKIVKNVKDLELNCVADMDEILQSFDESSNAKVSELFNHMCSMEMNFHK